MGHAVLSVLLTLVSSLHATDFADVAVPGLLLPVPGLLRARTMLAADAARLSGNKRSQLNRCLQNLMVCKDDLTRSA